MVVDVTAVGIITNIAFVIPICFITASISDLLHAPFEILVPLKRLILLIVLVPLNNSIRTVFLEFWTIRFSMETSCFPPYLVHLCSLTRIWPTLWSLTRNFEHPGHPHRVGLLSFGKNCIYCNFRLFFSTESNRLVLHQFLHVFTTVFDKDFRRNSYTFLLPGFICH